MKSDSTSSRKDPRFSPRNVKDKEIKLPGRPIGVIAVQPKEVQKNGFNPLEILWTVDRSHKDYVGVRSQG